MWKRARRSWERHFLAFEAGVALALTVAFAVWILWFDGERTIDSWTKNNRALIYATLASVAGVLLGFSLTAVSILVGYLQSDRFRFLQKSGQLEALWAVFFQAIWGFAACTALSVLGILVDREADPNRAILVLNFGAVAFASLRLAREIWVLDRTVKTLTRE